VPHRRRAGVLRHAAAAGPAELRPVRATGGGREAGRRQQDAEGDDRSPGSRTRTALAHGFSLSRTTVSGTAPPRASHTRSRKSDTWAHASVCSFWQTFSRITFRPLRRVTRAACWSNDLPWWYSSRAKTGLSLTNIFRAFSVAARSSTSRLAGRSTTAR